MKFCLVVQCDRCSTVLNLSEKRSSQFKGRQHQCHHVIIIDTAYAPDLNTSYNKARKRRYRSPLPTPSAPRRGGCSGGPPNWPHQLTKSNRRTAKENTPRSATVWLYEKSLLMDPEMATYSYEFEHPPRLLQIFALVWDPIIWAGFGARAAYKMRPVSAQMGF